VGVQKLPVARGVGDSGDLQTHLRILPEVPGALLVANPGVYYSNDVRRYLHAFGYYEILGGNTAWLKHYRLTYSASSPVRAVVRIRTGSDWKELTPLYNMVVMQYCGYWQRRTDGLWETPIDLVYPLHIYDLDGNGYYPVEEPSEVRGHAYYVDMVNRRVVASVPGLMMDGLRTAPTVQVYERVYPDGNKIRTRWKAHTNWAFGLLPDNTPVLPTSINGNIWTFPQSLGSSVVVSYYVLNTFCLFDNVLEIMTEPCDAVLVVYDIAERGSTYQVYSFERTYHDLRGMQLACVTPGDFNRVSWGSIMGRTPAKLEVYKMTELAVGIVGGVTVLGVRAVDESGQPIPGVRVTFSSSFGSFTYSETPALTDNFGEVSAMFARTGGLAGIPITVTANDFPGVSADVVVGGVGFMTGLGYQWIAERHSGDSDDLLVVLVVDEHGAPVAGLSAEVECLSGHLFKLPGKDQATDRASIPSNEAPMESAFALLVPKERMTLKWTFRSGDRSVVCLLEDV
jgi:hypothetical protein